jgi:15-cis-phytoene synthase
MTATNGRATGARARLPGESAILPLAVRENFSVASLALGRDTRAHLTAIYGFARLVDQLGDEMDGDRLEILDEFEQDLHRVFDGTPEHELLQRLAPTVRACNLPREPFLRLIEANRRDQHTPVYATFDELVEYCDYSANPVGELVLHVFGAATPDRIALSDRVCTALQLAEHWQDVGEDFRRGRIYLPAEDLERFGVERDELGREHASEALRHLLEFEVERARRILDQGAPLIGRLRGRARFAVAGYVGGGRAALEAIANAGYDVLPGAPRATRTLRVQRTLGSLRRRPDAAYDACRRIAQASGSSFYAGMRLLPADRRDAIFAVYALARRIDDVADGDLPPEAKLARLDAIRAQLEAPAKSDDPVLIAVAGAAQRFPIPLDAFGDLVDGAEMDARGHTYATFADTELYCRRVAGSIGRLTLGVFEVEDRAAAEQPAQDLGVALQLTNILRDLSEDLRIGRCYLPAEDLARFGCQLSNGRIDGPADLLVAFEAQRALGRLDRGLQLVPLLDRRSAACVLAMAGSYRRLLERIAGDPAITLDGRPSLQTWEKGWVLAQSVARSAA